MPAKTLNWKRMAILAVAVVGAAIAGFGQFGVEASSVSQPTSIWTNNNQLFYDMTGNHNFTMFFFRKTRVNGETQFEDVGQAQANANFTNQFGKTFEISSFGLYESYYDYRYELDLRNAVRAKLSLRSHKNYFGEPENLFLFKAKLNFQNNIKMLLSMVSYANYYNAGNFSTAQNASIKGKVFKDFVDTKKLGISAFFPVSNNLKLELTAIWESDKKGRVSFLDPSFLRGMSGYIKLLSKDRYKITGPKGSKVRLDVNPDGSGVGNLGYGNINLPPGSINCE